MKTDFQTPILLISFNRPVHTKQIFEEIKKLKPKYLFVFQDGERVSNVEDKDILIERINNLEYEISTRIKIMQEEVEWGNKNFFARLFGKRR